MSYAEEIQKQILTHLIDKYEASGWYTGDTETYRPYKMRMTDICPTYNSNYASIEEIMAVDDAVDQLCKRGCIICKQPRNGSHADRVLTLDTTPDHLQQSYDMLARCPRREEREHRMMAYRSMRKEHPALAAFADEQLCALEGWQKDLLRNTEAEDLRVIGNLAELLINNTAELKINEFSQQYLHSAKAFTQKYLGPVVRILMQIANVDRQQAWDEILRSVGKAERDAAVLAAYGLFKNEQKIDVSGAATLHMKSGEERSLLAGHIETISTDWLSDIDHIDVAASRIMTVENRAPFERLCGGKDVFVVYLAGYNTTGKTAFLRLLYHGNEQKEWMHFGDIDPHGFQLMDVMMRKTGIPFTPFGMDTETFLAHLDVARTDWTASDEQIAKKYIAAGKYREIMTAMRIKQKKVEQEMVAHELLQFFV